VNATAELTAIDRAIDRGTRRLLELQRPDGIWVGELESNVTMTAQHLFWNHVLGLRTPDLDRRIANELMARMRDDGTWSIWFEGPADLSTSIEAYVALRMCGVDPGPQALAYIQREGGIPKSRLFTKCFLALIGQWPWQRMVPIPPELVLLPSWSPFSIYNFACWARQTFVALAVAQSLRPVRPADVDLSAIGARPGQTRPARRPNALRRRALLTAEQWIRARQEADGSWGGIQPPWVWGIVALTALGHGLEDDTLRRAVEGWQGFMVEDGDRLRPEACQSPVWDTALAVLALRACGIPADQPQLAAAGAYLLGQEVTVKGDWAIRTPDLAPGGWAFEYENDLYPDTDDAAVISLALRELELGDDAVRRALDWLVGMQSRSGGWGAFDVDNQAMWLYKIPFCDFGKVTDEPSADVTAHALEMLGRESYPQATERGLAWLLDE
jgi:squalene-hopene/tetraprenyl-beta-curcumene cyclase